MHIAVIVTGGLSETLQATPVLRTLQRGLPGAEVILAAPAAAALVRAGLPGVAEVLPLRALDHPGPVPAIAAFPALRSRRLDAAVLCTDRPSARLLAYLAGIPRRVGPGGGLTEALLSEQVGRRPGENDAAAWLRAAALLGAPGVVHAPAFAPDPVARDAGESRLLGSGFEDGRILVAMAPGEGLEGGRGAAQTWRHERYAHLANQLAVRHGAAVVVLGTTADRDAVDATLLDLEASVLDLSGELGLDETAAVLARCDLLVSGDSPLLHLAAAVGTPAVGLFAQSDGHRHGPYGPEHRVIQAVPNGGTASLDAIRVDDVLAGIETTL